MLEVDSIGSDEGENMTTLVDLARQRADGAASRSAYVFLVDGETERLEITYGELDRQARAIAAWLQLLRAHGERAILLYPPGLDYIAAFFGCLYAGVVAVPAYPPQRKRALGRLQAILTDSGAAFALTTTKIYGEIDRLSRQDSGIDGFRNIQWLETDALSEGSESTWQRPAVTAQTIAFLQYTSGSTGSPKGVMVTHANLLHNQRMIQESFGHSKDTRFVGWLPLYHDMGLIGNVLQPLYLGILCVLMSPVHFIQKPFRWLSAISRYRATTSGAPNFAYDLCVRQISVEERDQLDLSSWSVAFNGAEPIHAGTLDRFSERFAPCGFKRASFYPCYGLAEATLFVAGGEHCALPVVTTVEKAEMGRGRFIDSPQTDGSAQRLVACGRTSIDQEVVVVNPETLSHCPEGEVGEIWVKGPSVTQGYWGSPEATAATFSAKTVDTGEGPFLRTGDLGVIQNEELFVVGRLKDLIIIRGRNHYPHDIEVTVQESHPSLRPGCGAAFSIQVDEEECLVVVQEIDHRAQFNLHEVAAVVRNAVAEQHDAQVYVVVLIRAGSLPKTSSGKIQRHICREKFLTRSLDVIEESMQDPGPGKAPFTRPGSPTEQVIGDIWAQVIGQELIGRDDHFFARGGDSLRAAQVVARLNRMFDIDLSLECLFEKPTVAQLAEHIARCRLADKPLTPALSPTGKAENEECQLSFAQQRLWFLDQIVAGVPLNNIPVALRLEGQLDIDALEEGLSEIVRRHETLRTTFISRDGQPIQVIVPPLPVELPVVDLRHVALSEREVEVSLLVQEEARRPFDLMRSPLMRASLLRLHETEHILMLTVHHIVADDWSMGVLSRELSVLYDTFRRGQPSPLPQLPTQYIDVSHHERQRLLQGDRLADLLSYWRMQLAESPPFMNFPTDRPRPFVPTFQGTRQTFALSKPLTNALKALSQREDVTLFMTLLAVFQTLLFRYTGQHDISIGCAISNREQVGAEPLIGCFVNLLICRTSLDGNPSFRDLLRRVREAAIGAYAHQTLPFEMLVEELKPERRLSQTPLFQILFVLQDSLPTLTLHEISVTRLETHSQTSKFDLTLSMFQEADRLVGAIEYSTDLFEAATIERLLSHYVRLLEVIVADPSVRLGDVTMLSRVERQQLLVAWNATATPYPAIQTIQESFEAQVARTPDAVAVVYEEEELTYGELNARANQLARYLRSLGVGPDALVGLCVERSLEMLVGLLGILKAGGAYVPLDPTYPTERLAYMLADSQPQVLLTQAALLSTLPTMKLPTLCLDTQWTMVATYEANNLVHHTRPAHLVYVIYTSGSTGRPKGVEIYHRATINFIQAMQKHIALCEQDVFLALTPLSFDIAFLELLGPLAVGARVEIVGQGIGQDAERLAQVLTRIDPTIMQATPSTWRLLLAIGWQPNEKLTLLCGGEALSPELLSQLGSSHKALINLYGPTETTIWSCLYLIESHEAPIRIGRPVANTQIYILDSALAPVPVGVAGELYIAGTGLARGYLRQPGLTGEKFIPNPFSAEPGARMYCSGDLARYLPDGNIEYLGRIDHQVKVRGFRIELGEIEAVLSRHAAVREAIVLAREDQLGEKRLVAYVVPQSEQTWSREELQQFLRSELPDYMVPTAIVLLDVLPLTPNGKVDRRMLPEPGVFPLGSGNSFVPPQSEIERTIATVWQEVLQVNAVGLYDNFFDIGGHSLQLARVWSKLRCRFQHRLSLLDLFRYSTIHALAIFLTRVSSEAEESKCNSLPIERIRAGQHRLKQQQAQRRRAKVPH